MPGKMKIVFVGDSGAGKSGFIKKWLDNDNADTPITIGLDFRRFDYKLDNNEKVELGIWDMSGNERDRGNIAHGLLRDTNLFVITIAKNQDIEKKKQQLKYWREFIKTRMKSTNQKPRIIVLETKTDIPEQTQLSQDDLEEGVTHIPVSAKNDINVSQFKQEVKKIAQQILPPPVQQQEEKLELESLQSVIQLPLKKDRSSGSFSCFSCFFSSQSKSERFNPSPVATESNINSLTPQNAKEILDKLKSRLFKGAIIDQNKEPYEVSCFGSDYVEYYVNDKQKREIKIPKTVAAVLKKIILVVESERNDNLAKAILWEVYNDCLKAAKSYSFRRKDSTQDFYENILPKFIEAEVRKAKPVINNEAIVTANSSPSVSV